VPRPRDKSRLRYYAEAARDRTSALPPVARLRERVTAARAPEPAGPPPDGLPLPPAQIRVLVDGSGDPDAFLQGSAAYSALIRRTVAAAGPDLDELGAVLDFGCGCGRIARAWAGLSGPELHGCDYNPKLVAWCRANLPFMEFRENELEPPSPYPDDSFDLVYAISILTHLTEPVARRWMAEWSRILKPGGLLLVSTHGDAFRDTLGTRLGRRYDAGQMVVVNARMEGANACVAHHPYPYVANELIGASGFELVSFTPRPQARGFRQDVYLARRASEPTPPTGWIKH
jgi:SAM-dependent methyltransferase